MPFSLTFNIPNARAVKTRAIKDPAQYDTEINTARGFKPPTTSKPISKSKVRVEKGITYDPDQYDPDENLERHYKGKTG
jgi:hypothetical protein